jgi:hypothetical protein
MGMAESMGKITGRIEFGNKTKNKTVTIKEP